MLPLASDNPEPLHEAPAHPAEISVRMDRHGRVVVTHRPNPFGCLFIFVLTFVAVWLPTSIFVTIEAEKDGGDNAYRAMITVWMFFFGLLWIVLRLFRTTRFTFSGDSLRIEQRILRIPWRSCIRKSRISSVQQVKDGGEGDDCFESYGLLIQGDRMVSVLWRQSYESTTFLGQTIADWADVPFEKAVAPVENAPSD